MEIQWNFIAAFKKTFQNFARFWYITAIKNRWNIFHGDPFDFASNLKSSLSVKFKNVFL